MSIEFSRTSDSHRWDSIVFSSEGATAFHDWSWLTFQAQLFGWTFEPLLIKERQETIGVLPLLRKSRSVRSVGPPFPYLGPLVPREKLAETLRAFRRWQLRAGVLFTQFEFGPERGEGVDDLFEFKPLGLETLDRTYVVDLSHGSEELLWAGVNRDVRRHVRQAERHGVRVRAAEPGEIIDLLPRVLEEAFGGRGLESPYPASIGEQTEAWCAARDDLYVGTALVHDEPAGLIIALGSHPTVFGWTGGCLRKYRSVNAHTVLQYDTLLWALRRGHRAVDMVGHVDEGVARFKRSLGGQEKSYLRVQTTPLPTSAMSLARRVYQMRR